jgi:hypothetical protein
MEVGYLVIPVDSVPAPIGSTPLVIIAIPRLRANTKTYALPS